MAAWWRLNSALLISRLVSGTCRLFRYPGSSLPGVIALKICPDAVNLMAPAYDRVIAITGTNGKTTTANILAHFLRAAGYSVAHNSLGANMLPGVATALFRDRRFRGGPSSRIALLEVDEGSVGKVFTAARPDLVVVTNYFRDQLDRYWELERTTALLREAVARLPRVSLVLNADDPLVATIGQNQAQSRYFGVLKGDQSPGSENSEQAEAVHTVDPEIDAAVPVGCKSAAIAGLVNACETREGRFCQHCGTALTYHYFHFGQLGDYYCSNCGFRRPALDYAAWGISEGELLGMSITIQGRSGSGAALSESMPPAGHITALSMGQQAASAATSRDLKLNAPLRGFYNVYNILAATAVAVEMGVGDQIIQSAIQTYKSATGRMQEYTIGGRHCTLALIKNPVGANEVLKTLIQTAGSKALVIAINDLAADGRDVSWLWDADFACLAHPDISKVICAGLRAADFAVCLKYAGVPLKRIELAPERAASLRRLVAQPADKLYVLATYTNLFDYARLLGDRGRGMELHAH
ncbi:MAG: MurT ligase domain-containing protein [Thermacetogeniaceae bacterium]